MPTLFTIGHSTRSLDAFLGLLESNGVAALADIRRFPGSRRHPHFGSAAVQATLARRGIEYRWLEDLGGRRSGNPRDAANAGWRVAAFRAYADHLLTTAGQAVLAELAALAERKPTAVMCAEALWSRCHRQLIADALLARGFEVRHILDRGRVEPHALTPFARVDGVRVTYPSAEKDL